MYLILLHFVIFLSNIPELIVNKISNSKLKRETSQITISILYIELQFDFAHG